MGVSEAFLGGSLGSVVPDALVSHCDVVEGLLRPWCAVLVRMELQRHPLEGTLDSLVIIRRLNLQNVVRVCPSELSPHVFELHCVWDKGWVGLDYNA